jgi:hypothetical protein
MELHTYNKKKKERKRKETKHTPPRQKKKKKKKKRKKHTPPARSFGIWLTLQTPARFTELLKKVDSVGTYISFPSSFNALLLANVQYLTYMFARVYIAPP